ncbi:hypothetical protein KKD52_18575 [Myxococcota bacterium]|nr:hypothetical protein [Myxococcota bacterium]MBU1411953.1 hypothetical protein [Myxococcota bacterium]MBU1512362.1 hypothetical protein [Myxococcota bacterium]
MKTLMLLGGMLLAGSLACTKVKSENSCGDAFLDSGEECDGTTLGFGSCQDLGYYRQNGNLSCQDDCTIDRAPCSEFCGDGLIQEDHEVCDGTALGGLTCDGLGLGDGQLACASDCTLDTAACAVQPTCGDGTVTAPMEQCEGADLQGASCLTLGYGGGTLACSTACSFELSGCEPIVVTCGNGVWDNGEECDGTDLHGFTCESQGFAGGNLSCTGDCRVSTSGCEPYPETCGNGYWENGEACDGNDLNGASCIGLGFDGGQLACTEDCMNFDTSPCTYDVAECGNNVREDGELCDGNDLNGETCSSRGFYDGTLACAGDCMSFDESYCVNP